MQGVDTCRRIVWKWANQTRRKSTSLNKIALPRVFEGGLSVGSRDSRLLHKGLHTSTRLQFVVMALMSRKFG